MSWLDTRFKFIAYFLLAIVLQDYCLAEALNAASVRATAVVEGATSGSVSQSDGSAETFSRDMTTVNTQGSVHSRTLKQRTDDWQDEDQFECGLSSSERRRYFDDSSQQWLVTDEILQELNNDVQAIVNCTSENDVIVFQSKRVIRTATTLTLPWNLTLRADSGATFTCPRRGPLLVIRTPSIRVENWVIVDCNGTSSVIVSSPRCGSRRIQGIIKLSHLTFRDNGVFQQGHIIEANGRCSELNITDLVFLRNRCIGTHCVILGTKNRLTDIHLVNNHGSNETSRDSSIFFASVGSETNATNVTSMNNTIRGFYVSSGDLKMINCHFEGNRRNQSSRTREDSVGGAGLFSNHSSVSISSTVFENNYAFNGGALFAWSSNITISECSFHENNAGEGNGGAIYGHYNSSFEISTSSFSKNRGYFGAGVHSNYTRRVDMRNVSVWESNCSRSCSIMVDNGFASIESSAFLRNSADRAAAALCTQASNLSLKNSTFVGNSAKFGGACIFQDNSTINASNLLFENNTAREADGGAISFIFGGRMRIRDSRFQNNHASGSGGAIHAEGECETMLKRVEFLNNTSREYAGALQIRGGNFTGSDLTFTRNRAMKFCGAISFFQATNVSVSSSHFEGNSAESAGAIQFFSTSAGYVDRCTFVRNAGYDSLGGAVNAQISNVNISSSLFSANTAYIGASLTFNERCNSTILNSTFENNVADSSGGAVSMGSNSSLILTDSVFSGNRAQGGGVLILNEYSNALLSRLQLVRNHAFYGGCLYLYDFVRVSILDSIFSNNAVENTGGAIYLTDSSELTMSDSTDAGNNAGGYGGGVEVSNNSTLKLADVSFEKNEAGRGGAIRIYESSNATISMCNFSKNC